MSGVDQLQHLSWLADSSSSSRCWRERFAVRRQPPLRDLVLELLDVSSLDQYSPQQTRVVVGAWDQDGEVSPNYMADASASRARPAGAVLFSWPDRP